MTKVLLAFKDLPVGARFARLWGKTDLMKVSTRTARVGGNGAVVWIKERETVVCDSQELRRSA